MPHPSDSPSRTGDSAWRVGERVSLRGDAWTITGCTPFGDCDALRVYGVSGNNAGTTRTVLVPFDRPRRLPVATSIRVLRLRGWTRLLCRTASRSHPFGGLAAAAETKIQLLPYQLEPALAVLRHGAARVMIADAVGLGKTVQAGLILNELAAATDAFRGLVVSPAGLRDQWARELDAHFGLTAIMADAQWLTRMSREMPSGINPWVLPGIYLASFDFIKRPEVLRPLEETTWDLLVVDEAHGVTPGTARRAAVHAVGVRSRRVLLLTATPHSGDPLQFEALCRIGETAAADDPVVLFRRSRTEARLGAPRRTSILRVRLSDAERRMHRLLEAYAGRVCREARGRGDARGRLAAIVLRKRALSSAASLGASVQRRLALLSGAVIGESQPSLPLGDEDPLEDDPPDAVLAAPGLDDPARERRSLTEIAEAAQAASESESKLRFVLRLLSRLREAVIIFTEYRDTLARLERTLAAAGHSVVLLHGGLTPAERARVQLTFNRDGGLLLATDAASEGLNLHACCRSVVHFELPWNPARLEQRTGRVDRVGQTRTVHEMLLVADDTAERLVLAPLARRAARANVDVPGRPRLLDLLTESRVAAAVMDGEPLVDATPEATGSGASAAPPPGLPGEAETEALRLRRCRATNHTRLRRGGRRGRNAGVAVSLVRVRRSTLSKGLTAVYSISLSTERGEMVHRELVAATLPQWRVPNSRSASLLRIVVREFVAVHESALRSRVAELTLEQLAVATRAHEHLTDQVASRERAGAAVAPSVARELVQAGLFDERAVRARAHRQQAAGALLEESEQRTWSLRRSRALTPAIDLVAVLLAL